MQTSGIYILRLALWNCTSTTGTGTGTGTGGAGVQSTGTHTIIYSICNLSFNTLLQTPFMPAKPGPIALLASPLGCHASLDRTAPLTRRRQRHVQPGPTVQTLA